MPEPEMKGTRPSITVRRLRPSDSVEYRRLRLRGLRESASAFGSTYAEESKFPRKIFVAWLQPTDDKWIFGAFENQRLVGVVTLIREDKIKVKHKASIYGMYVAAKLRRKGVGHQLVDTVLQAARRLRGLKQVRLAVVEGNDPALHLYEAFGFKVYGREVNALLFKGKYYAELLLALHL
jgi:RimJ/RimL family protein N-acetyltransferase